MTLNLIDVSSNNGNLNVNNVPCDGVIVKATEGTFYKNELMNYQIPKNKVYGFYHYARGTNYKQEADFFLASIKPYIGKIPIFLDFEKEAIDNGAGPAWAKAWLDYVTAKVGYKPLLYTYLGVVKSYDWSQVAEKYDLWLAQYDNYNPYYSFNPNKPLYFPLKYWTSKNFKIYQYSSTGYFQGVRTDIDVFYGNVQDWWNLAKGNSESIGDNEMTFTVNVPYNKIGGCMITNPSGAILYEDSALTKPIQNRKPLKQGSKWVVLAEKDGALELGGWIDSRDAIAKFNPLATNKNAKAIAVVWTKDLYTQNETKPSKGIKHLPLGSKWNVYGRDGKYLKVGNKTTGIYADGDKAKIVL